MSETSGGVSARQGAMQDFAIRYRTAVSASLASLASTTVGYGPLQSVVDGPFW